MERDVPAVFALPTRGWEWLTSQKGLRAKKRQVEVLQGMSLDPKRFGEPHASELIFVTCATTATLRVRGIEGQVTVSTGPTHVAGVLMTVRRLRAGGLTVDRENGATAQLTIVTNINPGDVEASMRPPRTAGPPAVDEKLLNGIEGGHDASRKRGLLP